MTFQLKEARIDAGYTIEHVAEALNIKKAYIVALEEGNFESLPGVVYINGYLKLYSKYLGIDVPLLEVEAPNNKNTLCVEMEAANQKFSKYLVTFSIIMLIAATATYHLVLKPTNNNGRLIDKLESYNTEN